MSNTSDVALQANPVNSNQGPVPLAVQSIITQTDKSGQQQRIASPTYDTDPVTTSTVQHSPVQRPSFFQRLFSCCRFGSRPSSAANRAQPIPQRDVALSNTPTRSTPSISRGRPAKFPDTKFIAPNHVGRKCLALDLDETLVHSSFQPVAQAHFVIPVTIEGIVHNVFVIKRPGVDEFMRRVGEHYEVLIYTASLSKYADPLLDKLDIHRVIANRLFRENCVFHEGHYVKDLSLLNRDIKQTIIVDNSPMSYIFHPENAIDCSSFIDDPSDVEMWQIADFLVGIKDCEDVSLYCKHWREWCKNNPSSVPSWA